MKAVRILTLFLATLAIGLMVVALLLPSSAKVERGIVIDAPVSMVFPHVNGMRAFHAWSPWSKIDPNTEYSFTGPEQGVGSRMTWNSQNAEVGGGSQEIVVSRDGNYVETTLDFGAQGDGVASFALSPEGMGTKVVWGFTTEFGWDLFGRWFGLMMDGLIGPSYEKGLVALKERVEGTL